MATTHAPRHTESTGRPFEYYCEYLLESAGYNVYSQSTIGVRPTSGTHVVDLEIIDDHPDKKGKLVSCKYQEVDGSAYEKIVYEMCCLQAACDDYGYSEAYILITGPGWKYADSFRNGAFDRYLNTPNVKVIIWDEFLEIFDLKEA